MAGGIRNQSGGGDDDLVENHEINVTPFIDVMLVLLIIFMVAAPLSTVDINVDLPVSNAPVSGRPDTPVWLTVGPDLALSLGNRAIAPEALAAELAAATGGDLATRIYLRADQAVAYGDHYYETVYVMQEVNGRMQRVPQQVVRTRWSPAAGRVARAFNDVLVLASTSLPRQYTDALAPWDLSHLVAYDPRYLSGFQAEGYTVPLADSHAIARQEMAGVIAMDVRRDIGGDVQQIQAMDTDHSNETFKHILLPVWLAAYKYNGKSYRFVVNGQSGRVQGDRPWSVWKIAAAVILALIAAAVLLLATDSGNIRIGSAATPAFAPSVLHASAHGPAAAVPPSRDPRLLSLPAPPAYHA